MGRSWEQRTWATNHAETPIMTMVVLVGKTMRRGMCVKTVVASLMMAAQMRIFLRAVMTVIIVMTVLTARTRKPSEYLPRGIVSAWGEEVRGVGRRQVRKGVGDLGRSGEMRMWEIWGDRGRDLHPLGVLVDGGEGVGSEGGHGDVGRRRGRGDERVGVHTLGGDGGRQGVRRMGRGVEAGRGGGTEEKKGREKGREKGGGWCGGQMRADWAHLEGDARAREAHEGRDELDDDEHNEERVDDNLGEEEEEEHVEEGEHHRNDHPADDNVPGGEVEGERWRGRGGRGRSETIWVWCTHAARTRRRSRRSS